MLLYILLAYLTFSITYMSIVVSVDTAHAFGKSLQKYKAGRWFNWVSLMPASILFSFVILFVEGQLESEEFLDQFMNILEENPYE